MKKKLHIYFSGKVQGVGFRYTAQDLADQLKIYGWVKNLSDGRVEIVAEAEEDLLNSFTEEIKERFSRYITNIDKEWFAASGEFRDFQVSF